MREKKQEARQKDRLTRRRVKDWVSTWIKLQTCGKTGNVVENAFGGQDRCDPYGLQEGLKFKTPR